MQIKSLKRAFYLLLLFQDIFSTIFLAFAAIFHIINIDYCPKK